MGSMFMSGNNEKTPEELKRNKKILAIVLSIFVGVMLIFVAIIVYQNVRDVNYSNVPQADMIELCKNLSESNYLDSDGKSSTGVKVNDTVYYSYAAYTERVEITRGNILVTLYSGMITIDFRDGYIAAGEEYYYSYRLNLSYNELPIIGLLMSPSFNKSKTYFSKHKIAYDRNGKRADTYVKMDAGEENGLLTNEMAQELVDGRWSVVLDMLADFDAYLENRGYDFKVADMAPDYNLEDIPKVRVGGFDW
ncbi:MAG: hypothetical protein PHX51_05005 [Clostridia bacterium]|nr:hypothetical protein [Clostridia bacterium]